MKYAHSPKRCELPSAFAFAELTSNYFWPNTAAGWTLLARIAG